MGDRSDDYYHNKPDNSAAYIQHFTAIYKKLCEINEDGDGKEEQEEIDAGSLLYPLINHPLIQLR